MKPLLILGAGGQARWAAEIAHLTGWQPHCVDQHGEVASLASGHFQHAHVAIGGEHELSVRVKPCLREVIMDRVSRDYPHMQWPALVHPTAHISHTAVIEDGAQILAQCSVGPNARVERGAIMASGALLEHDSVMKPFSYLTTGAATGGGVTIGERTFIGTNASIKHGLTVPADCLVGAGVALTVAPEGPCIIAPPRNRMVKRRVREPMAREGRLDQWLEASARNRRSLRRA